MAPTVPSPSRPHPGIAVTLPTGTAIPGVSRISKTHKTVIRCAHPECQLNQYLSSNGRCRKCGRDLSVTLTRSVSSPRSLSITPPFPGPAPADTLDHAHGFVFWLPVALVYLRLRAGLSQTQLAERIGKPRTFISKVELGYIHCIRWQTLTAYADGLGVSVNKIFAVCECLSGTKLSQ